MVTIEPSQMEIEKAKIEREKQLAEEEAAKKLLEEKSKKRTKSRIPSQSSEEADEVKQQEDGEDGSQAQSQDDPVDHDDDDDDFHFRVFFRKDEIRMAAKMQQKDQFADLIQARSAAANESIKNMGPNNTKFNILDFSPTKAPVAPPPKKKGKGLNKMNSVRGSGMLGQGTLADLDEEDSEEDAEYLASLEEHKKKQQ